MVEHRKTKNKQLHGVGWYTVQEEGQEIREGSGGVEANTRGGGRIVDGVARGEGVPSKTKKIVRG